MMIIFRAATFNKAAVSSLRYEYCVVNAGGIRSGTTRGLQYLQKVLRGSLIEVESAVAGINLLRNAFKLKVSMADLQQSFGKEIKMAKIPPANQPPQIRRKEYKGGKNISEFNGKSRLSTKRGDYGRWKLLAFGVMESLEPNEYLSVRQLCLQAGIGYYSLGRALPNWIRWEYVTRFPLQPSGRGISPIRF